MRRAERSVERAGTAGAVGVEGVEGTGVERDKRGSSGEEERSRKRTIVMKWEGREGEGGFRFKGENGKRGLFLVGWL